MALTVSTVRSASKARKATTTTDDALERTRREEPTGLTVQPDDLPEGGNTAPMSDPASEPQQSRGQTATRARRPDEPPGTEGYEDDVPTRPRGGAEGGTETKAPAAEVVEETVSVEEVPEFLRRGSTSSSRFSAKLPAQDDSRSEKFRELFEQDYDFDVSTPEGRRKQEALRRMAERGFTPQYKDKFIEYLQEREALPQTGPGSLGAEEKLTDKRRFSKLPGMRAEMEEMRQSTGGFIQEPRAKAAPLEPPSAEEKLRRVTERINELRPRLNDPDMDFGNSEGVVMKAFGGPVSKPRAFDVTVQDVIDEVAREDRGEGEVLLPFGLTDTLTSVSQIMSPSERRRFPDKAKILDEIKDDYREYERIRDEINALEKLRLEFAAQQ